MISALSNTDTYTAAKKLLDVTALRQEALAANIANADTPAYRRVDIAPEFETQLRARLSAGDGGAALDALQPRLAEDATARTVRPDGNTVELENELLAMNRNMMEHEFLTDVISTNLKQLKLAITGTRVSRPPEVTNTAPVSEPLRRPLNSARYERGPSLSFTSLG